MKKNRLINKISLLLAVTLLLNSVPAEVFAQETISDADIVAFEEEKTESEFEELVEDIYIEEESELEEISDNEISEEIVEETVVDVVEEADYIYYTDGDIVAYFYESSGLIKFMPAEGVRSATFPYHNHAENYPWFAVRNKIKSIEIGDRIKNIPELAFRDHPKLRYLKIGSDVENISGYIVQNDIYLETIEFDTPKGLYIKIAARAFYRSITKELKVINNNNNDVVREFNWHSNKCLTSSKVILNAQGGSCDDLVTVLYGSKYFLPTPTMSGYKFLKWQDEAGNIYSEDMVVDHFSSTAITLYAQWVKHDHNFEYTRVEADGGNTWNVECKCVTVDGGCEYNNEVWTGQISPKLSEDNTAVIGCNINSFRTKTHIDPGDIYFLDADTEGSIYKDTNYPKKAGDYYVMCNLGNGDDNACVRKKFTLLPKDKYINGKIVVNYTYTDRDGNTQIIASDDVRCKSIKLEVINPINGSVAKEESFNFTYRKGNPANAYYSYYLPESQNYQLINYQIKVTPYKEDRTQQTDANKLDNWKVSVDGFNNARIDYIPNTGVFDLNWQVKFENLPELENGVKPDKAYVKVICLSHSHNDTYWPIVQHTDSSVECAIDSSTGIATGTYPVWQARAVSDEPYYFGVQLIGYTFDGNYYEVTSQNYRVDDQNQSDNIVYYDLTTDKARYKDGHGGSDAVINLSISNLAVPMITLDPGAGRIIGRKYLASGFGETVDISKAKAIPSDSLNKVFSYWAYENGARVINSSIVAVDRAMTLHAVYKSRATILMNNMSMSYGDELPTGFVYAKQNDNSRDITSELHYQYSTDDGSTYTDGLPLNVGRYLIKAILDDNDAHEGTSDTAYLVIMKRKVYIVIQDSSKYINRPDPIFEYEVENIIPGDELEGVELERDEGEGLGQYRIYIREIIGENKNYLIEGYDDGIFTIEPLNMYLPQKENGILKNAKISGVTKLRYNGRALYHNNNTIKVSLGEKQLVEGKDYTLIYTRNIDAGTAYLIVSGNGIYNKSSKVAKFKIEPALIEACQIKPKAVYEYSAGGPDVELIFNHVRLKNGVDFKVKAKYDKKTATSEDIGCTYTIQGIGNFKGKIKEKFSARVKYANIGDCAVYLPNIPQGKKNIKPLLFDMEGFELKENRDYKLTYDKDATKVLGSDVTYTITGMGFFKGEDKAVTKVIPKAQDIGKAKIILKDKAYSGGEYEIDTAEDFKLAMIKDTKLDPSYLFMIMPQYSSNIRPGKYKTYVIGRGPLGGIKKVKYVVK